jgi:hypothetical protein
MLRDPQEAVLGAQFERFAGTFSCGWRLFERGENFNKE